jgi:hypothetical protein
VKHLIIFLGYSQPRIQHPVYRQFVQTSLIRRHAMLLFLARPLEERELVHEINELKRREGMPCELCFHVCASLDDPTMGQQIMQTITMIRRLYDRPSYVYCLLPELNTCTVEQKNTAWKCLVSINNGITDYPDVHLLSHCFLYHDASQVSLAHFLFDITQENEAFDTIERYGYFNKLHRPKTAETVYEVEFPAIFSSFNVTGMSYPENEIRYYMHQCYLNALLGLSRPSANPISMELCNEHVQQLLSPLPLTEERTDLTGESFISLNRQDDTTWLPAEDYWNQAVERVVEELQDKPREEWCWQLDSYLNTYYQTRYRDMGVEFFYRQEKKKTADYCRVLLNSLKEGIQQIMLQTTYPPETGEDIVRSIVNHLQLLTLHFNRQHTDISRILDEDEKQIDELMHRWERFGFFDRMRGKDKNLFEEFRRLITQHYIRRVKLQGADFAIKLLNEFTPQVSALSGHFENLARICQEAFENTRRYLDDNPPSAMDSDFSLQPVLEAADAVRRDEEQLKSDFQLLAAMLYGKNEPLSSEDLFQRLRDELMTRFDEYMHQRISSGTLPPILDVSIVERVTTLYGEKEGGLKGFVSQLKNKAAISLKLKGNGGHKEQYLLIAPECGGQLGPQIAGGEPSSLEMIHILTGISLSDLEGFAGQRMFVEPSIF